MFPPPIARTTRPKWIFSHFVVGNTYPYTIDDWQADVALAMRYGFDGFALNVGCEGWQVSRVADCFEAASHLWPHFKLFLSFDMASLQSANQHDVSVILDYLQRFAHHPSYLINSGGIVISTFAGQDSLFGFETLNEAWSYVKEALESTVQKPVHFIPSFFIDPRTYSSLSCMNGYFHWNGGWPIHLARDSPRRDVHLPKLDSDQVHIHYLGRRTYMAAISPWFFTHYGKDLWNKNWIYRGDDHLLIRRWEYLLSIRDQVDIVQLLSWNDYGESHYLSPVRGAQPHSHAWVDNCPHHAWLSLNALFIYAFKHPHAYQGIDETSGQFNHIPGELLQNADFDELDDIIWMWSRPHSKYAIATNDPVGKPDNWELSDDLFWVVTLTSSTRSTTLKLSVGTSDSHPVLHQIPPCSNYGNGDDHRPRRLSKFSHRLVPGQSMRAELIREGTTVAVCEPASDFMFNEEPESYNFNAVVCSNLTTSFG